MAVLCGSFCGLFAEVPAQSKNKDQEKPDFIYDTTGVDSKKPTVTSDQNIDMGVPLPNRLRLEGEDALRTGNLEHAITVLQRAVELSPNNMDGRMLYAEALEKKLNGESKKDPKLSNYLIKQWLFVAHKSEFADQRIQGYRHLEQLCGTTPRKFESEAKFLHRVLQPEESPSTSSEQEQKAQ